MAKKPVKKAAKKAAPKKAAKKAAPKKAAKKAAPKKAVKKAAPKKAAKKKRTGTPGVGLNKPYNVSAALGEIVGNKAMPRTEVVKKLWVYIKANKLQDAKNKRMINADAKLKPIFSGKGQVSMFEMGKHLSKHLS